MTEILLILGGGALLVGIAALCLFYPVFMRARGPITMARQHDLVAAYERRLAELDDEVARGSINGDTRADVQQELDRQLLADTRVADRTRAVSGRLGWGVSAAGTLALVIGLAVLYALTGDRQAVALQQELDRASSPAALAEPLADFIRDHPDPQVEWLYQLATAYRQSGQLEPAVQTLERVEAGIRAANTYDPEDLSTVLGERGELRFRLAGERLTPEAEADFQASLAQDPLNTQAMATLGVAYFSAGRTDDAIELWERFLEVAPDNPSAAAVTRALERAKGERNPGSGDAVIGVLLSGIPDAVDPAAQVYIVARPVGGREPVAIQRYRADEMAPIVQLTDADRSPDMASLSSVDRVSVVAFAVPPGRGLTEASFRSDVVETDTAAGGEPVTLRLRPTDNVE